jgi:hypothetical protein
MQKGKGTTSLEVIFFQEKKKKLRDYIIGQVFHMK